MGGWNYFSKKLKEEKGLAAQQIYKIQRLDRQLHYFLSYELN